MATTYDEYQNGWQANNQFRDDKRALNNVGSFSRMFSLFFALVGFLCVSQLAMIAYTDGWSKLRHPFVDYWLAVSVLMLLVAYPLHRRSARLYKAAEAKFDAKWRARPTQPKLPVKTFDDPITEDDLRLITMASVRLTSDYPELAQELATLKVRVQKLLHSN